MSSFRIIPTESDTWDDFVERAMKMHPNFNAKAWIKEHARTLKAKNPTWKIWTQIPEE
jgi:hypothetical protein